ncbi:AAA family ATPase [Candidatus Clostridium radicumherbarum]|uniref:Nuclease SbcCD subunit C n=1 Tax=Candidatus Clostridium radicumherbarum TaxID=3381662 RepID=A0ABW8TWM3_9CLOT
MKINKLCLKNFRIFRGEYEFDFNSSKLVIVYGQNGNGKSTIFDAIEWCITGELQRYKGSNERSKFYYIINNSEYKKPVAETMVQLDFNQEGNFHTIKRVMKENSTSGRKEAYLIIDGVKYRETEGNKKIQSILIKKIGTNKDENLEVLSNFKDLFSATQLLSQNELNDFVLIKKPQERFEVMETILGVEKYGDNFREYLKNIGKHIQIIIDKDNEKIKQLLKDKTKLSEELLQIRTKIEEQEKHFSNIGSGSEKEIAISIINVLEGDYTRTELGIDKSDQINEHVQQRLIDALHSNEGKIENCKNIRLKLLNAKPILSYDINHLQESKKALEDNFGKINRKYNRRNNNVDKYNNLIEDLNKIKKYKSEYTQVFNAIKEIEVQINLLKLNESDILNNSYCTIINKKFVDIQRFKETYENYSKRAIDIDNSMQLYDKEQILTQTKREIQNITANMDKLLKEREVLNFEVSNYDKKIKDITSQLKGIKEDSQKQLVYNIQQHLIKDREEKICPVCGTDFKSHVTFINSIKNQLEESTKSLDALDKERLENISMKSQVNATLTVINNNIRDLTTEISAKEKIKTEFEINIEELRIKSIQEYSDLSKEELVNRKNEFNTFILEYKVHYEFILKLRDIQKDISDLTSQKTDKYKRTNLIEELLGNDKKYLNKYTDAIDYKIGRYEKYVVLARQSLKKLNLVKRQYESNLKEFSGKISQYVQEISNVKQTVPMFLGTKDDYENWETYYMDMVTKLENKEGQIQGLLRKVEEYLSRDDLIELKQVYALKNEELKKIELVHQTYLDKIQKYNSDTSGLESVKDKSKQIQSNLISSFMNKYSNVIDKLFFQITPHAFAKHVYLIPRNGNLYIIISVESGIRDRLLELTDAELSKEINASLTLSSAQTNVLAVCIFMVMNLSQKWSELELMAIDDPFQNMDDINVFSFIDTLSGVLGEKQVIISTHSSEFASLIQNKASLSQDEVSFIQLNSYGVDGVDYEVS